MQSSKKAAFHHPAKGLQVSTSIQGITDYIKTNDKARAVDFSAKYLGIESARTVNIKGQQVTVSDAEFVDTAGSKMTVSVWQSARSIFEELSIGTGVAVVGCNASVVNNEVKLKFSPGGHICTTGCQAESLSMLDVNHLETTVLTSNFTVDKDVATLLGETAYHTCAAALNEAVGKTTAITFQINRCILDAPWQQELLLTKDSRLFIKSCWLRDSTGCVQVDVINVAVPALYDCEDEETLRAQIEAQSLTRLKARVNVRGILRAEGGITRRYIVAVEKSCLESIVSMHALRSSLGLSEVTADVVIPVPANRVVDSPVIGMAVVHDNEKLIRAHRVLLLAQGTCETVCESLSQTTSVQEQTFKLTSNSVRCLLCDAPSYFNLVGYSDMKKLLTYRLDNETALILASSVTSPMPGAASADGNMKYATFMVEYMQKVGQYQVDSLKKSLTSEWKAILKLPENDKSEVHGTSVSVNEDMYWTERRMPALKRIGAEPQTSARKTRRESPCSD